MPSLPCPQDFINIELDSHRNQLIQLELLLTAAMFAMALVGDAWLSALPSHSTTARLSTRGVLGIDVRLYISCWMKCDSSCPDDTLMSWLRQVTLVAGLFGMNLNNTHEDSYSGFVIVSCS